jgi:hypothetical protein
MEKLCRICNVNKSVDNFYKTSNGRGLFGVGATCKECQSNKDKIYLENNKLTIKEKRDKIYQSPEGRKKVREYQNNYYQENKDKLLPTLLERQKKNRKKINERNRKRYNEDILFKLKHNIKRVILKNLNGEVKKDSTISILGCSIDEFKKYIESNWEEWMSWDNYGKYSKGCENFGWDIDHIIPISSAKTTEEVLLLNHYTNLRPLCSYINRYIKKDII